MTQLNDADVCRRIAQLAEQTPNPHARGGFAKVGSRLDGLRRIVTSRDGSRLAALLRRVAGHDDKVRPSTGAR